MSHRFLPLLVILFLFRPGAGGSPRAGDAATDDAAPGSVTLVQVWEVPIPGTSAPYLVGIDGGFVVADHDATLSAFSAAEAIPRWTTRLEEPIVTDPVPSNDSLVILMGDTTLAFLNTDTGDEIARHTVEPGRTILNSTVSGVFVGDPSGRVRLFDPADGVLLWSGEIASRASAGATLCGGVLLVGTVDGTLYGLEENNGSIRLETKLGGAITTPAACNGNMAYVGSTDDQLHAIKVRRKALKPKWDYRTGGDLVGTPIRFDGHLLFFSYDTYLYALKEKNGHLAWKVRLGRRPRQKMVMLDNLLLSAPLHTETLDVFKLPEGTHATSFALRDGLARFVTAPALAGDHVVIGAAGYGGEDSRVIGLRVQHEAASAP